MYTLESPILSPAQASAAQIQATFHDHNPDVPPELAAALCGAADPNGVNHDILAAQVAVETGWWTSEFATQRNNPAGIGAVDSAPGEALFFRTIGDGFTAEVAHMRTYTDGEANPLRDFDPRYPLVLQAGHAGQVRKIGDLGNGIWATDPDYAGKVLRAANAIISSHIDDVNGQSNNGGVPFPQGGPPPHGGPPEPPTGGSMRGLAIEGNYSLPVRMDLANNGKSFPDRPGNPDGRILAIVKHVTAGESLDGALSWNRSGLNADGSAVQASAHFYIDKSGVTVQDVSLGNSAWSNGILQNDTLPAQFDWVKQNRLNPNDFTIAIEHVGNPDDADFPTEEQLASDARLTADLCDAFQIPVDTDHIIGHNRFDAVNRPNCPGPHWDFDADVRRVSDLLNGGVNATGTGTTQPVGGHATGTGPGDSQPGGTTNSGAPGGQSAPPPGSTPGGAPQPTPTPAPAGGGGVTTPGPGGGVVTGSGNGPSGFPDPRFFERTGHTVSGPFLVYYTAHGYGPGDDPNDVSPIFGYPRTGPFVESSRNTFGQPVLVQYFDKGRLELRGDTIVRGNTGLESLQELASIGLAPADAAI